MAKCIADSTLGCALDAYLYSLAKDKLFATIGSDDCLRMFDAPLKSVRNIEAAHDGISCLSTSPHGFVTAGRDALIRRWDARSDSPTVHISETKSRPFSSIACQENYIAAGTESNKEGLGDVSVLIYDTRNVSNPVRNYAESHSDSITQLAFHPTQKEILLSGSTDGLVSIFDVNIEDEDDALQRVLNPRSAVHCAGFFNDVEVYVTTTDEQFSIYSLAESNNSSTIEFGDVREELSCMYIVNIINAPQPMMAYGHNLKQTLSIVQLDPSRSYNFGARVDLLGAHGEEVVRDLLVLDADKRALSCGEDGHVKLWDLAGISR